MQTVTTPEALAAARNALSGTVGFVPTMGALHEGHLALIKRAREENDHVVVSVFVNPTQFLPGEDLAAYPRKKEADTFASKSAGVSLLFMPEPGSMYGEDEVSIKAPMVRGYVLEGKRRPGHFDGVLTVVMKLLNMVRPDKAYFGKKDAQQLLLIREMVEDFFLPVEIVPCDTVRAKDGLALSSRNAYLSPEERQEALKISAALRTGAALLSRGERNAEALKAAMEKVLEPLDVEYVAITDRRLEPVETVEPTNGLFLIAAKVGTTRLIDNFWI